MAHPTRAPVAVAVLVAALAGWILAPALSGQASFALRDSARYYYPLFQWTAAEWAAGRVPLWNPLDNLGMSVVGEGTSSVFYPGKLIFALPLDFTLAFNLYIVAHMALAAWGAYRLARRYRASVMAAGLAAMCYAFSGDVLFQVTNVVFLVGAAWLPWAFLLADRTLQQGTAYSAIGPGGILALMITGGDPQMAVNTALLVGLYALLFRGVAQTTCCLGPEGIRGAVHELATSPDPPVAAQPRQQVVGATRRSCPTSPKRERGSSGEGGEGDEESLASASGLYDRDNPPCRPTTARALGLLAIAFVTAALLAAVQILPSWQSTRESARASFDAPRNVYELAAEKLGPRQPADSPPWYVELLSADPQGHAGQTYQFSVSPWRAIEFVWPNVSGRQFPTFHRWLDALPAEGRVWAPSLYLGLLPFVLAVSTFSLRSSAPTSTRFASWMVVLGGLSSLGIFGAVWFVRQVYSTLGGDPTWQVGDQVGGLYWLLTVVVPGYAYFRYPAKLMILVALGLAMLAAAGWDRTWQGELRRLPRIFAVLAVASVIGLAISSLMWNALEPRLAAIPPDPLFGPFDAHAARRDVTTALAHTALLSVVFALLLSPRGSMATWSWAPLACLAIAALDLAIAQTTLMSYAPADAWASLPQTLSMIGPGTQSRWPEGASAPNPSRPPELRFYRDPSCANRTWLSGGSLDRAIEGLRWERNTLTPRYHLPYEVAQVEVTETLSSAEEIALWQVARRHADPVTGLPHDSVLDLLGARSAIVPAEIAADPMGPASDIALQDRPSAMPRAWIVHEIVSLGALSSRRPAAILTRTEEVLFPDGQPRNWRREAVIETADPIEMAPAELADVDTEDCRVTYADPQRVEITASLARPGLVVLRDRFDPGWRLLVETDGESRDVPILRANRLMRGSMLPPGKHHLVYRYQPSGFWAGAIVSGSTTLALAAIAVVVLVRRRVRATAP